MALLAGLTGGMGSGKTTVGKLFQSLGAYVLDADEICRSLVEFGKTGLAGNRRFAGQRSFKGDQTLDRRKIADIVFNDPEKKKALEAILHPRVMEEEQAIYKDISKDDPGALVIIDAALLIESENYRKVDKVIVIACDEETQLQRIMAKNRFHGKMPKDDCNNKCLWKRKSNLPIMCSTMIQGCQNWKKR